MSKTEETNLRAQLKLKLNEKGATSRLFKNEKKSSAGFDNLVKKMCVITDEIKNLEQQLKELPEDNNIDVKTTKDPLRPSIAFQNKTLIFADNFSIKTLPKQKQHRWSDFLSLRKASTYQSLEWQSIIQASFNHKTIILVAEDDEGNIIAGLPITIISSFLFGRMGVSAPYVNYGGVESDYLDITKALLSYCGKIAITHKLKHVEIRTMQAGLSSEGLSKKASMLLKLPSTEHELETGFSAKVRAQYKKAEINDPTVKFGKLELLADFYYVFSRNMRDLGTPVYSQLFFRNILSAAGITSTIAIAYLDGKPVSAGFLIGNNDTLEIPWASTLKEANSKNMNMWVYRKILSYAVEKKFDYFDFGRSTKDAGTYKFKKQWGAQAFEHHWYYFGEENKASNLNTENPKLQLLIKTWKILPVWLTRAIGPFIVRGIP